MSYLHLQMYIFWSLPNSVFDVNSLLLQNAIKIFDNFYNYAKFNEKSNTVRYWNCTDKN